MNPMMFHSTQDMAHDFKQFHNSHLPQRRSVSLPRSVSYSTSHLRKTRIISAIRVLLDELDADGLRDVVDEAQHRIRKLG
ncbi:hypothetical protein LOAG_07319 [Loa loa]|uniref:Uncharacterized protein n=1 Tax=Loa loa TaxID=7209 RepID=A0A1I7V8R1_LOALO|nr:hypothetical protein LOAG_07319 [Loa loa]EFO21169.1 hypothetical protein LOAG_07319 [Loa loa]